MRIGLISDVHANLPALQAVLTELSAGGVDRIACAGDLVGYGPMPNECIAAMAEAEIPSVAGNHDLIAIDWLGTERCSALARTTLEWTRGALTPASREYLASLPGELELEGMLVAHGAIGDAQRYVMSDRELEDEVAVLARQHAELRILVLGHTHRAQAFSEERGALIEGRTGQVRLGPRERGVVNPGSVGQARVGRPRARFAVIDCEAGSIVFRSVAYDTGAVRRALGQAGLPRDAHRPPFPVRHRVLDALRSSAAGPPLRRVKRVFRAVRHRFGGRGR